MRNLLLSEYYELIGPTAALFGAQQGADVTDEPRWEALLRSLSASISLRPSGVSRALAPKVVIGHALPIVCDPTEALVRLAEQRATILRALGCLYSLGAILVWGYDCPCDRCSASGKTRGGVCDKCAGTGLRQETGRGA